MIILRSIATIVILFTSSQILAAPCPSPFSTPDPMASLSSTGTTTQTGQGTSGQGHADQNANAAGGSSDAQLLGCGGTEVAPSAPTNFASPSTDGDGTFTLTWTASTGMVLNSDYRVSRSLNGGAYQSLTSLSRTATSYTTSSLADGNYTFRILACNEETTLKCSSGAISGNTEVRRKPSTPAAISNVNSTSSSVTLHWTKPSGTVTYYSIRYRAIGSGAWSYMTSNTGSTSTAKNHTGRSNNTNYEYKVRACNTVSWACSGYSAVNLVKVRFKPSIPAAITNVNSTSSSVALNWTKPSGTVTYYSIRYQVAGSGSWAYATSNTGSSSTSYTHTGRSNNTNYEHKVRACNEFSWACSGYGAVNSVKVRFKPSTPAAITNVNSTSSSVTLNWAKPSGTVTYYSIRYQVAGSGSWSYATSNTGSSSTSYTHTGRSNNTNFEHKVRACNEFSWACSGYSSVNSVKVRFKPSAPAKPSDINSTSTSYTMNWTKPSGTVSFYSLQERVAGGSWSTVVSNTSATSRSITGKIDSTNYQYRVRACNSYTWACSGYSSVNLVKVRIKPGIPVAPTVTMNGTSLTVYWVKPSGNVTHYNIEKSLNMGGWTSAIDGDTGLSETFNLGNGSWRFRVMACNDFNCTSASSASSPVTITGSREVQFIHTDLLGSPVATSNKEGNINE